MGCPANQLHGMPPGTALQLEGPTTLGRTNGRPHHEGMRRQSPTRSTSPRFQRAVRDADESDTCGTTAPDLRSAASSLELYWVPLGAGTRVVRISGRLYEAIVARARHRPRADLFHSALVATDGDGRTMIEMAPIPDTNGSRERGVVAEGPVGTRWLGRLRVFRYEVRRWRGGHIPDLEFAVASPVGISDDPLVVQEVLDLLPSVPTPVWGRDELRAGEMWNSNSVVAWVLTQAGIGAGVGRPPFAGRAPGWDAGVMAARRSPIRRRGSSTA